MKQYNVKGFLLPEGINSMAAVQTKIQSDGRAVLRISDCNNTVKIWNNINNREERDEMIEKLSRLQSAIEDLKDEVLKFDWEMDESIDLRKFPSPYETLTGDFKPH